MCTVYFPDRYILEKIVEEAVNDSQIFLSNDSFTELLRATRNVAGTQAAPQDFFPPLLDTQERLQEGRDHWMVPLLFYFGGWTHLLIS